MSWMDKLRREWRRKMPSPGGGLSGKGLERVGKMAAASAMVSANFAARAAHLGVSSGAQAVGSATGRIESLIPGAGLARRLAETVDREASAAARAAAGRYAASLELISGKDSSSAAANGGADGQAAWSELAADTALAPLGSLVASSLAVGVESIREVAATRPGQMALDAGLERLGADAGAALFQFETSEQRKSFVVVTTDSGAAAIRTSYSLAEAVARLAFSDTRQMRQTLEDGLQEMRNLADSADMQDLLPTPVVSESLQTQARLIVDHAPLRFIQALGNVPGGESIRWPTLLAAARDDVANLRLFFTAYPRVLSLIGRDVGKLLVAGKITFTEMEAFFEGRRFNGED